MNTKINKIIEYLTKLPGIGPRQAVRLALALAKWEKKNLREFSGAIEEMADGVLFCKQCFGLSDEATCKICRNGKRLHGKIAVVEDVNDIEPIEKAGFDGTYHVLGGALSPGNNNLRIKELIVRVASLKRGNGTAAADEPGKQIEVIIATNPNTYGETTALYLKERLAPLGIKITRLAQGLSAGASIEYSDEITLAHALEHRK